VIAEHKKLILSDYLKDLGNEISNLYHTMDEDEEISNDRFNNVYEALFEKINYLHMQLQEETYFS
jgi:hypothetical protein